MSNKKLKKTMEEHCKNCAVYKGEIPPPQLGCCRYPPSYCLHFIQPGYCYKNSGQKQESEYEVKIQSEKANA